jgi:hypothetical protein
VANRRKAEKPYVRRSPKSFIGGKFDHVVEKAKGGDEVSLRKILSTILGGIEDYDQWTWRASVPWAYVQFVADVFKDHLKRSELDRNFRAIFATPRSGRPAGRLVERQRQVAAAYGLLLVKGFSSSKAKEIIDDVAGKGSRTIERYNRDFPTQAAITQEALDPETSPAVRAVLLGVLQELAGDLATRIDKHLAARSLTRRA